MSRREPAPVGDLRRITARRKEPRWSGTRGSAGACIAATGALALVATACGDGDGSDTDGAADDGAATEDGAERRRRGRRDRADGDDYCAEGGTAAVRWAHEQEPPDMHLDDPANNLSITSWIQQGMLEGLYGVSGDDRVRPRAARRGGRGRRERGRHGHHDFTPARRPAVVRRRADHRRDHPGQLRHLHGGLRLRGQGRDRRGLRPLEPPGLRADRPRQLGGRRPELLATPPSRSSPAGRRCSPASCRPTSSTDGAAANDALREMTVDGEPLPASGPFQFSEWQRGVSMTLTAQRPSTTARTRPTTEIRNQGAPCASGVEINFVTDTDAQVNALRRRRGGLHLHPAAGPVREGLADDPSSSPWPPSRARSSSTGA